MSSRMLFRSTPFIASREANVCRRSCHRKFSILALSTAGEHTLSEVRRVQWCLPCPAREDPAALEPARQCAQDRRGGVVQRHVPRPAVLRTRNREDAVRQVHVLPTESELLALA